MFDKQNGVLALIFTKKMLITFLLGFSSGLPLQLTGATLKFWLSEANVDITTIGYFGWVGMAYSLKFIWAPLADRYSFFGMGRRRSWMVLSQIAIAIGLVVVGVLDPKESLVLVAAVSVWIAFFSATQDIAYDAFRREYLDDKELGFGSSMNMYGYRIGMLISSGVALGMAAYMSWTHVYWIMAVLMGVGIGTTLYSKESRNVDYKSKTLRESVIEPFKEFIQRNGAILILLFVFFFKLGDALSGSMLSPFYKEMGYQKEDIALIAKTFGLISSMLGLFIGGITIYKIGILRSLWIFGILQALSTASFALITYTGPEKWALAFAVIFEDITAGMGSSAFIAYLASITNRNYTATQFAVLSSIATLGRNFFSGFSGVMVKEFGWEWFFYSCALIALPGMGFLYWVQKSKFQKVGSPTEEILSKI